MLGFALLKSASLHCPLHYSKQALNDESGQRKAKQGIQCLFVEAVEPYRRRCGKQPVRCLRFLINNDMRRRSPPVSGACAPRSWVHAERWAVRAAMMFAPTIRLLSVFRFALVQSGNMEGALRLMQDRGLSAGAEDPSGPAVLLTIIKNHIDREEWYGAVEASRSFIKAHGDSAQVQSLMAEAFRNLGNTHLALAHFRRALSLDRSNPSPHYGILMVHIGMRDWVSLAAAVERRPKPLRS